MNNTDLETLRTRLSNCNKELDDIQKEKSDLEQAPEQNATRIEELKHLEEAKTDQINQIKADIITIESKQDNNVSKKEATESFLNAIEVIGEVVKLATGQIDYEPRIPTPTQQEYVLAYEQSAGAGSQNTETTEEQQRKTVSEVGEQFEKLHDTQKMADEEKANDKEPVKKIEQADEKNTLYSNSDKQSLSELLEEYKDNYNEGRMDTGSNEQAEAKAMDKLLEKLETQQGPDRKNDSPIDEQSKKEKITDLLNSQYGQNGKEEFDKIKEQEKERQQERQQSKQNEQSKNM